MIRWIKYRFSVKRIIITTKAAEKRIEEKIRAQKRDIQRIQAGADKPDDDPIGREVTVSSRQYDIKVLELKIMKFKRDIVEIHTEYLLNEANLLGIPYPVDDQHDDILDAKKNWLPNLVWGNADGDFRNLLSPKGISELRSAIRKERKERSERWRDVAGFLFGAGGFAIAALSLLSHLAEVENKRSAATPPPDAACVSNPTLRPPAPASLRSAH